MNEDPYTHPCIWRELDYSNVDDGQITCTECGRTWTFMGPPQGWVTYPPKTVKKQWRKKK